MRAAIYTRFSAALPLTAQDQCRDLCRLAVAHGWTVASVHSDSGMGGGKAGKRRPALTALAHGVQAGSYDVVIVHSMHLIGRDLAELVQLLTALKTHNVRLIALGEGIDTSTNGQSSLLDVGDLLAAHVRFGRREAMLAGQQRAKQIGVKFGRPSLPNQKVDRVRNALGSGVGIREAGRAFGVSPASVLRIRDQM